MTKLIIVRHGETQWNVENREMGQLDAELTPRGLAQAEQLAARLQRVGFARVYSSDLGRAARTAEIIAKTSGVDVSLDIDLRERHMGIFQGLTPLEMRQRFPFERQRFEEEPDYPIPGGESGPQRSARTIPAITGIAERHPGETTVIVTHSGVLRGFFEYVLAMSSGQGWRFRRDNASYNAFEFEDGKWTLVTWNDTSHLQ